MAISDTLLAQIKTLAHIEADEDIYDDEVTLLIHNAIGRMKMAGINTAILGLDNDSNVVTVGSFSVGQVNVGQIITTKDTSERALEYISIRVKMGLYQEASNAYYQTLLEIGDEQRCTMRP